MDQEKFILKSKTIIGGLITVLSGVALIWGVDVSPTELAEVGSKTTESVLALASVFGGLLSIYGRFAAKSKVVVVPTPT